LRNGRFQAWNWPSAQHMTLLQALAIGSSRYASRAAPEFFRLRRAPPGLAERKPCGNAAAATPAPSGTSEEYDGGGDSSQSAVGWRLFASYQCEEEASLLSVRPTGPSPYLNRAHSSVLGQA